MDILLVMISSSSSYAAVPTKNYSHSAHLSLLRLCVFWSIYPSRWKNETSNNLVGGFFFPSTASLLPLLYRYPSVYHLLCIDYG